MMMRRLLLGAAAVLAAAGSAAAPGGGGHYTTVIIVPTGVPTVPQDTSCLAGVPADPDDVRRAKDRIERTMASYFALTSGSSVDDIRDVFADDRKDVAWKQDGLATPIAQVGAKLGAPPTQRSLVVAVVGGDVQSARAIWAVTPATGSATTYYAADFVNEGLLRGWKIWHLAIFPESKKPDTPSAYCHFDPDQGF